MVALASVAAVAVALGGGGAACPATKPEAPARPRLHVERVNPLALRGLGFPARARVRIMVVAPGGLAAPGDLAALTVCASAAGVFRVVVAGIRLGRCGEFLVTATAPDGSTARAKSLPRRDCAPIGSRAAAGAPPRAR